MPCPDLVRRRTSWQPTAFVTPIGAAGSALLVLTAGRATMLEQGVRAPGTWWGLLTPPGSTTLRLLTPIGELAGLALLSWAWWVLVLQARAGARSPVQVARTTAWWALPALVGPPLLSLDAYSYLAQGRVALLGADPYHVGPQSLGPSVFLAAVDPRWRASPSPYGPVALLAARLSAAAGPTGGLVVLRVLAALALVGSALLLIPLCSPRRLPVAWAMLLGNPLVLLQLLGAAHWEALIAVALLAALALWHHGHHLLAIALASTSAAVKAPLALAVVLLAGLFVLQHTAWRGRLLAAAKAGAVALVPWAVSALVQPHPFGFVAALSSPLSGRTDYAPVTATAEVLSAVGHGLGITVHFAALLTVLQWVGEALALVTVTALLLTARRRTPGHTLGLALLWLALLSPVVYPWYLTWGVVPLVAAGRAWRFVAALSVGSLLTALPGCQYLRVLLPSGADAIAPALGICCVLSCAAVIAVWAVRSGRAVTATAG